MDKTAQAYEQLIDRFVCWGEQQPGLRAALIIGSRARTTDHPADEWADLDLLLMVETVEPYITASDWVAALDTPWLTFVERTPDGGWERRVLFAGGLDVDFALLPVTAARQMLQHGLPPMVRLLFQRGVRIILDKDGLLAEMVAASSEPLPPPQPPSEQEFLTLVNDFWYHTVWTAKHLRRGELWWAKAGCDGRLKELLQRMLEWHAQAQSAGQRDTWFRGRFLEEWIDPRARQALPQIFAHYDAADLRRALFATMDLFRWLAVECAEHLRYGYPAHGAERATGLVQEYLLAS